MSLQQSGRLSTEFFGLIILLKESCRLLFAKCYKLPLWEFLWSKEFISNTKILNMVMKETSWMQKTLRLSLVATEVHYILIWCMHKQKWCQLLLIDYLYQSCLEPFYTPAIAQAFFFNLLICLRFQFLKLIRRTFLELRNSSRATKCKPNAVGYEPMSEGPRFSPS